MKKLIALSLFILVALVLIFWFKDDSLKLPKSSASKAISFKPNTMYLYNFSVSQKQQVPVYATYIGSAEASEFLLLGKLEFSYDGKSYTVTFKEIFDGSKLSIQNSELPIKKLLEGKEFSFFADADGKITSLIFDAEESDTFKEMAKNILSILWWKLPSDGKFSISNERFIVGDLRFQIDKHKATFKKTIDQVNQFFYLNFIKPVDQISTKGLAQLTLKSEIPNIIKGNFEIAINNPKDELIYRSDIKYKITLESTKAVEPKKVVVAPTLFEDYDQTIDLKKNTISNLETFAANMSMSNISMIVRLHDSATATVSDPLWFPKAIARLLLEGNSHLELKALFETTTNVHTRALILDLLVNAGEERFIDTLLDLIKTNNSDNNYIQYLQRLSLVTNKHKAALEYLSRETNAIAPDRELTRQDMATVMTYGSMISRFSGDEFESNLETLTTLAETATSGNKPTILVAIANTGTDKAITIATNNITDPDPAIRVGSILLAASSLDGKELILRAVFDESEEVSMHALTELKRFPLDSSDFEQIANHLEEKLMSERTFAQLLTICDNQFSASANPLIEYFKKHYNKLPYSETTKARIRDLIEVYELAGN